MSDNKYQVIITIEHGIATGQLTYFEADKPGAEIGFDPTTVLCDLLDTVDYEKRYDNEIENYFINAAYYRHPFSAVKVHEDLLESRFHSHALFTWFYNFIIELKELCEENRNVSLSQFEVFKQFFDAHPTYRMEFQEDNPYYGEYLQEEMNGGLHPECEYIYRGMEKTGISPCRRCLIFIAIRPFAIGTTAIA